MSPSELSLLRKLNAEVNEVGKINIEAGNDARILFREFLGACANYNAAVSAMAQCAKPPEGDYPSDREAWNREFENLNSTRRNAHEVVIGNYNALTRFCRLHRKKDLAVEAKYLGDLALAIRRGLAQAKELDSVLFNQVRQ